MMEHLDLPACGGTCRLSVIDSTTDAVATARGIVEPILPGHERLNLPTYCYLISNDETNANILFDLGMRKDWWNAPPAIAPLIEQYTVALKVDKDISEILEDAKFPVESIKAVVLSHHHIDHVGNLSLFPHSTEAIVGPGFKKLYTPFYPAGQNSPFHEHEFAGRNLVELDFASSDLKVGGFAAIDYFGDGSCYLLHTPGHTPEHLAALVRTTAEPATFVFIGGDTCHFMGMIRPNKQNPMPEIFSEAVDLSPVANTPTSSSDFIVCHPQGPEHGRSVPFYCVSSGQQSLYIDPALANEGIERLAQFDADPRVMVTIAHDPSLRGVLPLFPHATINDWKEKGYKDAVMWNWAAELPRNGKRVVPLLVDGLYKDGKKIRDLLPL